jgi:hypothetical protein
MSTGMINGEKAKQTRAVFASALNRGGIGRWLFDHGACDLLIYRGYAPFVR